MSLLKGTVSGDFLLQIFFHESSSPKLSKQGAPPVSTTPTADFATSSAGVVDTGGKQWEQYQTANNLK
jgi:hypothetical protein